MINTFTIVEDNIFLQLFVQNHFLMELDNAYLFTEKRSMSVYRLDYSICTADDTFSQGVGWRDFLIIHHSIQILSRLDNPFQNALIKIKIYHVTRELKLYTSRISNSNLIILKLYANMERWKDCCRGRK